jgi:hypothetical protein
VGFSSSASSKASSASCISSSALLYFSAKLFIISCITNPKSNDTSNIYKYCLYHIHVTIYQLNNTTFMFHFEAEITHVYHLCSISIPFLSRTNICIRGLTIHFLKHQNICIVLSVYQYINGCLFFKNLQRHQYFILTNQFHFAHAGNHTNIYTFTCVLQIKF